MNNSEHEFDIYHGKLIKYKGDASSVEIPYGVTEIARLAFDNCTNLTSLTIPVSVKKIDIKAFCRCINLTSIAIPSEVTSIANIAFEGCSNLTGISVDKNNPVYYSDGNCVITRKYNSLVVGCAASAIPYGVTEVEWGAFRGCTNLVSITIPDSVTRIGMGAFAECSNLRSVKLPEGLKSLGNYAFAYCNHLSKINIPNGINKISHCAFEGTALEQIEFPNSVTTICSGAFCRCTKLKSIEFSCNITKVEHGAFSSTGIRELMLPCCEIENYAFEKCNNLTKVNIPESNEPHDFKWAKRKFPFIFRECDNLKTITCGKETRNIKILKYPFPLEYEK